MKKPFSPFLLLITFFLNTVSFSQSSDRIRTHRPSQSISAFTVGQSTFQHEFGLNAFRFPSGSNLYWLYNPTNFFRFGLTEKIELNATLDWFSKVSPSFPKALSGFGQPKIGLKANITERDAFSFAFMGEALLPSIDKNNGFDTGLRSRFYLAGQLNASDQLAIIFNLVGQFTRDFTGLDHYYTFNLTFSPADHFGWFVEHYASISPVYLPGADAGIMIGVGNNLQLDLFGGVSNLNLNPYSYVSAGLSWRLHKKN